MPVESEDFFREIPHQENENPDGGPLLQCVAGSIQIYTCLISFFYVSIFDRCLHIPARPPCTYSQIYA